MKLSVNLNKIALLLPIILSDNLATLIKRTTINPPAYSTGIN